MDTIFAWEGGTAGAPAFSLDGLSLVFLIPILLVSGAAALFAPRYLDQERYRGESRLRFGAFYALFVLGMVGAVLAADLITFLVSWELMTLSSYVLVIHETREAESLRAAFKYFVVTHAGTGCLLLAAAILRVHGGSWRFDAAAGALTNLASGGSPILHAVMALLFVGFATKGGLYPFGDWLPDAHPAAPAPVSAVLSGVMVKLGLYGFLRFFVEMLGAASPADAALWGWILGGFGLLSALLGGFAAASASDVKVLLAYSSIAQSGIIALGIGASLVLAPVSPGLAALALLGAVFHAVGDAVVKALLFLNAGAVQFRMGGRRLADLGGLFPGMPVTAWTALLATLAMAGFPPFTAFTGKWLMLQATVLSGSSAIVAAGLGLLLASLVSVLYSVRFFAGAFLTRPPRPGVREVPAAMQASQLVLAGAVLALSLVPGWLVSGLVVGLGDLPVMRGAEAAAWSGWMLGPGTGAIAPLILVIAGLWIAFLARSAVGGGPPPVPREVWACGIPLGAATPDSAGLYDPIRGPMHRIYHRLPWPRLHLVSWVPEAADPDRWFYLPVLRTGRRVGQVLRRAHTGVPQLYLAWQLAGAVLLAALFVFLLNR